MRMMFNDQTDSAMKEFCQTQQRRFTQTLRLSLVIFLCLALTSWLFARPIPALVLTLAFIAVFIIHLTWYLSPGRWQLSIFIAVLFCTCFSIMWFGRGLQSTAILALPGIMIFAALVGSRKWFFTSFVLGCVAILLVFVAGQLGWRPTAINEQGWPSLVANLAVFISLGLAIHWLLSDLMSSINQLKLQIKRSAQSHDLSRFLTESDLLTGLPNRSSAFVRFSQMQEERQNFQSLYMVVMNIDHFKRINVVQGVTVGDKILRRFAAQLRHGFPKPDQVFRIGADEFLILLKRDQHAKVEQEINDQMTLARGYAQELELGVSFSFSAGIARWPNDALDASELFAAANLALNEAKKQGRDRWCYYQSNLKMQQKKDSQVLQDLRQALLGSELKVYYQPIIDLQQNCISKCEALLRWTHPKYGVLAPSYFVALAESSGLIHQLGDFVLKQACQDVSQMRQQGHKDMIICVNVSVTQLIGEPFVQSVLQSLAQHHLPPSCLELEITEEVFCTQHQQVLATIRALSGHGVSFAIDDFGTGYSNLINLQRLEVNTLKIDRSLINNLHQNKNNRALVAAVVQMAHSLNLELVAEGIEYLEEARLLSDLGCHSGQGYYWARALCLQDLLQLNLSAHPSLNLAQPKQLIQRGSYD